jgi:hypothetical protein
MIAENCEAVFGRPIMLQINGSDHVYDLDHKRDRCGGLITWARGPQQKKPALTASGVPAATGHSERKVVGICHD